MCPLGFYEFFAGGGMARLGLGKQWKTVFANDIDPKKGETYRNNFTAAKELFVGDINDLSVADLPSGAALAWASFPCQDLSLAGQGKGLQASRSGCYWPFWNLMKTKVVLGTPVPILAIENVIGLLTSNKGADFERLLESLSDIGYHFGAMVVDAIHFLPQSRPRLFIVAARPELVSREAVSSSGPIFPWHSQRIIDAVDGISERLRRQWVWWNLPAPPSTVTTFDSLILENPESVEWHSSSETEYILSLMSPLHRRKVAEASDQKRLVVGTIYRRTRPDKSGKKTQRAEVRFDGVAGCLRTPAGGSSRQTIIVVKGKKVKTRLLDTREAARLMGIPDSYKLPGKYNEAYHLLGDGLAVPAVSWVERHVLRPLTIGICVDSQGCSEAVA